ncbi:MAG: Fur family transcriptional regulator [Gammaproteobacteria bacterium]
MKLGRQLTQQGIEGQLEEAGVSPTPQRVEIARIMLSQPQHMSAEDVLVALRKAGAAASKATVYNTLRLFAQCGLLRTVIVDPTKVFYDSNTVPHHHFYDVEAGTLTDFRAEEVQLTRLPDLPKGAAMDGVDITVRVRTAQPGK